MTSSSSANSTISSYLPRMSSRLKPAASPPSTTLSRPDSLRLKPTPSASRVDTRPCTSMRPSVGGRMPAIDRISVDLPAPLAPTTPSTVPCGTSKETSLTARMRRLRCWPLVKREIDDLRVGRPSTVVTYVIDRSFTDTAVRSDPDSELTLPGEEQEGAADDRHERPEAHHDEL